ncbi:MAG: DUF4294 domain-containing protein [Flavobacteriales bacterium]|nr:DUF4294 domain-containing protein [Flavobacteriales bacterium]
MNMPHRSIPLLLIAYAASAGLFAQQEGQVVRARVSHGDTLIVVDLPGTEVDGIMGRRARREFQRYTKLTRTVQKVYPYARITGDLLREYEHDLARIDKRKDQELYLRLAEAELKAEFEADIRDLTISQGRMLIRLIDRETGDTSYELVKRLRGSFEAFIWQGVAKLFGNDLKDTYDPAGVDRYVEFVVQRIERGELATIARKPRTEKAQARLEKRKARLYRKYGGLMGPTSAN